MTQPNLPAIRKRLAEWLGWEPSENGNYASPPTTGYYVTWRPDVQLGQAWMLLEKCDQWIISTERPLVKCSVAVPRGFFKASAPTAPLAITLAVYAAVGGGE